MKMALKIVISAIIGLITMWLCYQVFHLEQVATTVVSIVVTTAAYSACDKIMTKK